MRATLQEAPPPPPEYYKDAAVVAFRVPANDVSVASLQPKITSSGGPMALAPLIDGDYTKGLPLPIAPVGQKAWIQYEFMAPQTIRAFTFGLLGMGGRNFGRGVSTTGQELEASDDGGPVPHRGSDRARAVRLARPSPLHR